MVCGGVMLRNHTRKPTLDSLVRISQTSPVIAACAPGKTDGEDPHHQPGTCDLVTERSCSVQSSRKWCGVWPLAVHTSVIPGYGLSGGSGSVQTFVFQTFYKFKHPEKNLSSINLNALS